MAEKKAGEQAKPPAPDPAPDPAPELGAAGESSDPVVHQLLAEREIADRNGDAEAVKAADARLAGLGVK